MSKFNLDKAVTDIVKYQKIVMKKKEKGKEKKKDITIREFEVELENVLYKLIARDEKKYYKKGDE